MVDIFITNIKTEYDTDCYYVQDETTRTNVVTGYSVEFILNDSIKCKIHIDGNDTCGCRETIKDYIKDKITGGIK